MKRAAVLLVVLLAALAAWRLRGGVEWSPLEPAQPERQVLTPEELGDVPATHANEPERESPPPPAKEPRVTVRVLDLDERPIAGASVETFDDTEARIGRTDADGRCEVPVAPSTDTRPGESFRLRVVAEGFREREGKWFPLPEVTIHLPRVVPLVGRVLDADGRYPIGFAKVRAPARCRTCGPREVTADAGGNVTIPEVAVGEEVRFVVSAEGYPTDVFFFEADSDAEEIHYDFLLRAGIEVHGRVVDWSTGAPVVAEVRDAPGRGQSVTTDATGAFRGRFLPEAGRMRLAVEADGFCDLVTNFRLDEVEDEVRLPLFRPIGVVGTVRDADGRPVAGATVRVEASHHTSVHARVRRQRSLPAVPLDELADGWRVDQPPRSGTTVTDVDGSFGVTGLVPWTPAVSVRAAHPGHGSAEVEAGPAPGPGGELVVDVSLAPAHPRAKVAGIVTLNGEPFGRGYVSWESEDQRGGTRVGADGTYELADVLPGRVVITLRPDLAGNRPRYGSSIGASATLDLVAGQEVEHDFAFELSLATISGRVTSASGEPYSDAQVFGSCEATDFVAPTNTGADGRYEVTVPDGAYRYAVTMYAEGAKMLRENVAPGSSGVDFVLPERGTLLVRVVATDGAPPSGVRVHCRAPDDETFHRLDRRTPDPDGWMRYEVRAGTIDIWAEDREHVPAFERDVAIPPRGETRVELKLPPGLELQLTLAEGQGPFPTDVNVLLLEDEAWESVRHWSDESCSDCWDCGPHFPGAECLRRLVRFTSNGTVSLRTLPAGRFRFKSLPDTIAVEPEWVELTKDGPRSVELSWHVRE